VSALSAEVGPSLGVRCADVLACIDGSDYLPSVCDHAAWLAGRCGGRIKVLSVEEPDAEPDLQGAGQSALLAEAAARIEESGAEVSASLIDRGLFAQEATRFSRPDDILVVGRRGLASDSQVGAVGASVTSLLEATDARLLICGRVFLAISRALILAPLGTGGLYADFIAATPVLDGIDSDIAVVGKDGLEAMEKPAKSLPRRPLQEGDYDLVVAPRALLAEGRPLPMAEAARASLKGRRPVLII
jgi:hypothetical protein